MIFFLNLNNNQCEDLLHEKQNYTLNKVVVYYITIYYILLKNFLITEMEFYTYESNKNRV